MCCPWTFWCMHQFTAIWIKLYLTFSWTIIAVFRGYAWWRHLFTWTQCTRSISWSEFCFKIKRRVNHLKQRYELEFGIEFWTRKFNWKLMPENWPFFYRKSANIERPWENIWLCDRQFMVWNTNAVYEMANNIQWIVKSTRAGLAKRCWAACCIYVVVSLTWSLKSQQMRKIMFY